MAADARQDELWTSANKVTFTRIVLIPLFVIILLAPWPGFFAEGSVLALAKPWLAALVFIALSATDAVDGYLARSRGEVTDFGKFMDPLADKLLVTAALLALIELDVLPSWVVLVIVSREFIVSGLRMIAANKGEVIAASYYGKVKTVFQMIAIVMFIVCDSQVISEWSPAFAKGFFILSWVVMGIALVMTVVSMFDYLYKARSLLGFSTKNGDSSAELSRVEKEGEDALASLAAEMLDKARERRLLLATAESCTGGLVSSCLTAIPGSSDVFCGGIVSYSNEVKHAVLHVNASTLQSFGAVSEQTACEMANGALDQTGADVAVSLTGIAGPGGGSEEKPVGTVWIGLADSAGAHAVLHHFEGGREEVRLSAAQAAIKMLSDHISA